MGAEGGVRGQGGSLTDMLTASDRHGAGGTRRREKFVK